MRRKKHKQTRRATNYYRINYGFHEPYKVLLDGNFIHATKAINMGDLVTHLPKLLGGTCKLYTTKCVTKELRSLGKEFAASAAAARDFPLHKCEHGCGGQVRSKKQRRGDAEGGGEEEEEEEEEQEQGQGKGKGGSVPAAECIRAAIGSRNEGHWFVATQDAALRQELGKIPGCPLVFATVNGIHLETPSEVTRRKAKETEEASRSLGRHERAAEPLLREEELAALRREAQRQREMGKGGLPPPTTSARFRRNKAKGPNPLASKKKTKKPPPLPQQQQESGEKKRKAADPSAVSGGGGNGGGAAAAVEAGTGTAAAAAQGHKRRRKRAKESAVGVSGGGGEGSGGEN